MSESISQMLTDHTENKTDPNEGESFGLDSRDIFEGFDLKEETAIVTDSFDKSESKSFEYGDIDSIEGSENIMMESGSQMLTEHTENKTDSNEGKNFGLDSENIIEGFDFKEETTFVTDIFDKSESKSFGNGDIDSIEDSDDIMLESGSQMLTEHTENETDPNEDNSAKGLDSKNIFEDFDFKEETAIVTDSFDKSESKSFENGDIDTVEGSENVMSESGSQMLTKHTENKTDTNEDNSAKELDSKNIFEGFDFKEETAIFTDSFDKSESKSFEYRDIDTVERSENIILESISQMLTDHTENKTDPNEGENFGLDSKNIIEGFDFKEETAIVTDSFDKSETKSFENGNIDSIEDSDNIMSESGSQMLTEHIENKADDSISAVKDDASEITFETECDEADDTSVQDNSAKGIDNEGFEFGSLSDVNIEKDLDNIFEEEISEKNSEAEPELRVSKTNEQEPRPEKTAVQVEKSESDNSISSDASSSFPTSSESESELVTVRENIETLMDEDDIVDESTTDQNYREPITDSGTADEMLNIVPDDGHQIGGEKALNLTELYTKREESEVSDINDSETITSLKEESKESVDKESRDDMIYKITDTDESFKFDRKEIDSEQVQTVGDVSDTLIMIDQAMTESYLTVDSISSVETPVGEHSSGFYEVNPETKDENFAENLDTNSPFETNLGENETGFYEVNKYQDEMSLSAVTVESVSSVDTPENGEGKGFYEINAELLEQAIENDDKHFLKIGGENSDASVSPLETPETEGMKGFYDINAVNLEKAIERIDSLDVSNSLMVESTYSDDSSVSPMETPELEHVSGFYEMSINDSNIVEDKLCEVASLGPEDAPEINIELVGSPNSSKDSFDSETEPSFELNDNKSMEEERKVNEETKAEKKSDVDLCSQTFVNIVDLEPADSDFEIKTGDNEVKEHVDIMASPSSEFDTAPEINIEMTSSTDTEESHQSAGEGFYDMNAEIQGTMLQNITIGNAFSPIESPSEEVFSIDYEINPMVPDVNDNSDTESSEENSPSIQHKPFVRFFVNDQEINNKVDEMADALVVTALSEAIDSLQEQNYNENEKEDEEEKTDDIIDFDKSEESEKYFKMADDLVNEAISNAIEVVQDIRLKEEEPFIKSEIASAMKESSDSSDSDASSTTTEGSYRIVDSVDLSPIATPDREVISSSDLVNDKDNVVLEEIFEEKDLVTREDFFDRVDEFDTEKQMFTNEEEKETCTFATEIVVPADVSSDSHYLNDENGNITVESSEPDLNLSLETEIDCSVLKELEDVKELDDKTRKMERQETLIPDIVISTEETPPGSDESEIEVNKEVVKSDEVDLAAEVTESVIDKKEVIDNMSDVKLGTEISDSYEITEHGIDRQKNDTSKAEGDENERLDELNIIEENLIAINENGSEKQVESVGEDFKAEVSDLIDDSEKNTLNENQKFKQQREVFEEVIINGETPVLKSEVNSVHTGREPVSDIVNFDQMIEGNVLVELHENVDNCNNKPITQNGSVIDEQNVDIEDEKTVILNDSKRREEVQYHNIKDLEGEKDEKKSGRTKKGQSEYVTRKEIFYTSAGRMSISIDSVVDPPSDSDQGYTGGQDIIHEESQEPIDDDDDAVSEKHVVIEKVELEKPKASHEKMKMDDTQEWHEDPIPGMGATTQDSSTDESDTESDSEYTKPARPDSLLNGARRKKKIAANNFLSPDSTDDLVEGVDDIPTPDDLETPSDIEGELEWEDDTPITPTSDSKKFVEYRDDEAEREKYENTKFRKVEIAGKDYRVDMKVIEPYKKVLSHGGYYGDGLNAIILFCGCYLPDRGRRDYQYVMDNLFLYVISTLELLVAEDYMIVYFHGATPRRQMPSFGWLKRCYQMIDRRLRKNLKALLMVHPTLWLKTVVMMTKPFISSKFSSKLRFVKTLQELGKIVPMEYIYVPEPVSQYDAKLTQHRPCTSAPETPSSPS